MNGDKPEFTDNELDHIYCNYSFGELPNGTIARRIRNKLEGYLYGGNYGDNDQEDTTDEIEVDCA